MNKLKMKLLKTLIVNYVKEHVVIATTLLFLICSILFNILSGLIIGTPYYNDIVHIYPIAILSSIFDPNGVSKAIMGIIGAIVAISTDVLIGFIIGLIVSKIEKIRDKLLIIVPIIAAVYFIVICFQCIPIIYILLGAVAN